MDKNICIKKWLKTKKINIFVNIANFGDKTCALLEVRWLTSK